MRNDKYHAYTTQTNLLQNFTPEETEKILAGANAPEYKAKLMTVTKKVVEEQGAFGCPWYWVTNAEGKGEPFFGSDRYARFFNVGPCADAS